MSLAIIGSAALLCGLVLSAFAALVSFWGGWRSHLLLTAVGRRAFTAAGAMVVLASGLLILALVSGDFALAYVTEHSSRGTPIALKLAAFYGGEEGSLLYWALVLVVLGGLALRRARALGHALAAFATGFLALTLSFLLVILTFVGSPFDLLLMTPPDGLGLNPLLRDGGMLIHPPFLLAGMSSFAVPFSFAMAALMAGETGSAWITLTRRFTLLSWGLQGTGLLLGMWWAYHVLGWGGYWGWDPVENVALLPWLAATAYVHSSQVQETRGTLRAWNFGLVIAAFGLSIFGTFVVRSGVIQSVHSFAVSSLGPWFITFLAGAMAFGFSMLWWRRRLLRGSAAPVGVVSREGAFYLNNLILLGGAFAILWGTLLPVFSPVLGGGQAVVGAGFYERVAGPLFLALLALLAVGPLVPWQPVRSRWSRRLGTPGLVGAGAALALGFAGDLRPLDLLVAFVLAAAGTTAILELRAVGWRSVGRHRRRYGAHLAHLGLVILACGVAGSHLWQQEREVVLRPGQSVQVASYDVRYLGSSSARQADSVRTAASLALGAETLTPSRTVYPTWGGQALTGVAIRSTPFEDLYVVLGGVDTDGSASFLVFVNPLVTWVWAGGALLILGILLGAGPAPAAAPAVERTREPAALEAAG